MNLASLFLSVTLQLGLPVGLLDSLCAVESRHDVKAYTRKDGITPSYGVCQIKYNTARDMGFRGTPKELMQPENNVLYAGKYLKHQLERYKGNYARAITAYNQGTSKSHGGSQYLAKVFNCFMDYRQVRYWREESGRDSSGCFPKSFHTR